MVVLKRRLEDSEEDTYRLREDREDGEKKKKKKQQQKKKKVKNNNNNNNRRGNGRKKEVMSQNGHSVGKDGQIKGLCSTLKYSC